MAKVTFRRTWRWEHGPETATLYAAGWSGPVPAAVEAAARDAGVLVEPGAGSVAPAGTAAGAGKEPAARGRGAGAAGRRA